MSPRLAATAVVSCAVAFALGLAMRERHDGDGARCGAGFVAHGARCLPRGPGCPPPLVESAGACDAPDARVLVPASTLVLGPSDWEAEGLVAPRVVKTGAFRLDAFEVTRGRWARWRHLPEDDLARAASGMTREEAAAYCAARGGRLPTADEWMAAASASRAETRPERSVRRYAWGDTGAVCRRAAWGLADGPCASGADGPDTVGAHVDGDSALGLHDMAGNVAEWVAPAPGPEGDERGAAKGGSWRSALATELRSWAVLDVDPHRGDPRVGFRCAYAP